MIGGHDFPRYACGFRKKRRVSHAIRDDIGDYLNENVRKPDTNRRSLNVTRDIMVMIMIIVITFVIDKYRPRDSLDALAYAMLTRTSSVSRVCASSKKT